MKKRKQFILDTAKILAVKEITQAKTETEAVNRALDEVIANSKIQRMLRSVRAKGNIKDIYGRVSG